mgnify:FL=1
MNYKKAYLKTFNHLTDLIDQLIRIQQEAEELLIGGEEADSAPLDEEEVPLEGEEALQI